MRILLDTCTFLWIVTDAVDLSPRARSLHRDENNELYLSAVSTWEIALKNALGRLPLPDAPETYVPQLRSRHEIDSLSLQEEATLHLGRLPPLHRDPFDRMLVAQAIVEGMTLLTPDEAIRQYPVRTMW